MFAAYTAFQIFSYRTSTLNTGFYQFTNTNLINSSKRIIDKNFLVEVIR